MFKDSANIDPPASRTAIAFDPRQEIVRFEHEYPEAFRIFRLVGIHPEVSTPITNPFAPKNSVGPFGNIGLHSIAVAMCVEILHARLVSQNVVRASSRRRFVEAALLHDVAKPYEICRRLSVANTPAINSLETDQTLFRLLLHHGFREEDALLVVTSGLDAGHRAIRRLMYVDRSGHLRTIAGRFEAKVLFLSDNMVQTSIPQVGSDFSENLLIECGERLRSNILRQRYPWLREGGFALDENFELVEVNDTSRAGPELTVVGTYLECLLSASEQIAVELVPLMGLGLNGAEYASSALFDLLRAFFLSQPEHPRPLQAIGA